MDPMTWTVVVAVAILAVVAFVLALSRPWRSFSTKISAGPVSMEARGEGAEDRPDGGAVMRGVKAGRNAINKDQTGRGATMQDVEAGQDAINVNSPPKSADPKA